MTDTGDTGRDSIERALWSAFVSRTMLPGQAVMVAPLATQLRVTTLQLCDALEMLVLRGLVLKTDDWGYRVRPLLTERELAELFVVRNRLEPWLAEEAARAPIPATTRDQLRTLASVPTAATLTALAVRDTDFHELIGALSGLTFASRAVDSLNSPFHIFRRLDGHSHAPASDSEHVAIAEAIIAGDPDAARVAMQRHLSSSSARLLALA